MPFEIWLEELINFGLAILKTPPVSSSEQSLPGKRVVHYVQPTHRRHGTSEPVFG
jgi:hypothetical protein